MNLIIVSDQDAIAENRYRLTDERLKHIVTVLRSKPGDTIRIGIPDGPLGHAVVTEISAESVTLRCEDWHAAPAPPLDIDMICAIPRPKTLKKVLSIAAAMGVHHLHMVRANRTDKSYVGSPLLERSGYMPYFISGLAQAKQTRLPLVHVHPLFRPFAEDLLPEIAGDKTPGTRKLLAHPETTNRLNDVYGTGVARAILVIGPEGGWVPFEIDLLIQQGFKPVTLGPWTLRVEYAVVAMLAQLEQARAGVK